MDNKNSFVLYGEYMEQFEMLSLEDAGRLTMAILHYVNNHEITDLEGMAKMAFAFIKKQLDRDSKKWEETVKKRSEAGKKGMEKRWGRKKSDENDNNIENETNCNNKDNRNNDIINTITNVTDNVYEDVNVNEDVNVDVNVNDNENEDVAEAPVDKFVCKTVKTSEELDRRFDMAKRGIYIPKNNKDPMDMIERVLRKFANTRRKLILNGSDVVS